MLTTDCIILRGKNTETEVLLIQRANAPFKNKWALPGGFVEMDEEIEHAASRELEEETGLTKISLTQFRTFGKLGRDPRGRTVSVVFFGYLKKNQKPAAGSDAKNFEWYKLTELPPLAFDHEEVLQQFREFQLK
jgi:8-oxo-dGTP diphosphatase